MTPGDMDAAGQVIAGAGACGANGTTLASDAHGTACLNCGTARIGAYCHRCGQADHVHRSIGAIVHDLLHGVLHFEGKILHTLPLLVFRPGELTRRYIAGERARFVSPLALFLFTVFVMFAVFSAVGPTGMAPDVTSGLANTRAGLESGRSRALAEIASLERQRAVPGLPAAERAAIDRQVATQRDALRSIAVIQQRIDADGGGELATGSRWLDKAVDKIRTNPSLVAYKVQSSAYKYSWALILMSVPLVALLFAWRRGYTMYDHAVFVTYSIGFMSLLTIAMEIWLAIGGAGTLFWLIVGIVPPVHMFVQLRGAYRLASLSALWRTVILVFVAFMVMMLFAIALTAMGASG